MRALVVLLLVTVAFAGCSDAPSPDEAVDDAVHHAGQLSEKLHEILPVIEEWIPMDDGKRMHTAVYLPDTDEPVPVFINFSPYWGDTAELGGDAFSQYMINEYVPRGYAVVLAALRGTGHSEGCFSIGGDREVYDMHLVVDHFANAEWSNGLVATGGKSYDSSPTNGLIAKFPHPALRGVFHVSGITDMYAYNYKGGVPYATGPIFNTYYYLQGTDEYGVSLVGAGGYDDEDAESLARLIDDVACPDLPFVQASGIGSGVTGLKDDYWIERDWTRYVGESDWNGSIFFVHGLQDWNVKPDHILPWITELPEQINVKGWLHQGGHVYPERQDWNLTMLRWLDSELKGIDTGFWDEPRWEVRSDNGDWYTHDAWPPALWDASSSSATPTATGAGIGGFDDPLHLSGSILLELEGRSSGDGVVTAIVYDEAPDGTRTWLTEGVMRTIYQDGLDFPNPDQDWSIELLTHPFDHILEPGHRLSIDFQADLRYGIVLPTQLDAVSITDHVIHLPVAEPTLNDPQPADMECFAC